MAKLDVEAVGRMLTGRKGKRRGYDYGMASFTLDGETFEYLTRAPSGRRQVMDLRAVPESLGHPSAG